MLNEVKNELFFEYDELEQCLIIELKKFKYGELKKFCHEKEMPYHEVSRLRSGKTKTKVPYLLASILKGLGYTKVLITVHYGFRVS